MKVALLTAAAMALSGPAFANPLPSVTAGPTIGAPAGEAAGTAGRAVTTGSGAHGGVPAPIVSGADSDLAPTANGVTDGTAKIGKGAKETGNRMDNGTTVSPSGAVAGAKKAPDGAQRQAEAAKNIPPKP